MKDPIDTDATKSGLSSPSFTSKPSVDQHGVATLTPGIGSSSQDVLDRFHLHPDRGLERASDSTDGAESDYDYPDGGSRAWGVVLGGFLLYFVAFGLGSNSLGVFQTYYYNERPGGPLASQSDISWIGSFQVWCSFASALASGAGLDRVGPKRIVLVGTIGFVSACMLISIAKSYWSVFLCQGLLQGLSLGLLFAPALACTSHFFNRRRGLALGVVASGSSMGGVVWPIVLDQLLHHTDLGFGWTLRICGFVALALLLVALSLVRTRLPPLDQGGPFLDLSAFRNPSFSFLVAGQFLIYLGLFFLYFYLPSLAALNGMPTGTIFYLASAGNGASFFGRIAAGLLGDRLGRYNVLLLSLFVSSLIVFATIPATRLKGDSTIGPLYAIASTYGLVSGAFFALQVATLVLICPDPKRIGTWIGMLYATLSLPGLFGPPIGAQLIMRRGFPSALAFAGTVMIAGTLLVLASRLTVQRRLWSVT
ncbi:MFS general substrate transporter [Violaceomyces palustris]|uniref:MFS general substrate transporter n=1 Tax=Violaceomyces palustris TaxID=1673888 RepID=A0ACD0P5M0_9BASI|nr:MFS general substrate transporter [Violaceomyces palustris]